MFPSRGEKRIAVFIIWFMKMSTVILLTMSSILEETVSTAFLANGARSGIFARVLSWHSRMR